MHPVISSRNSQEAPGGCLFLWAEQVIINRKWCWPGRNCCSEKWFTDIMGLTQSLYTCLRTLCHCLVMTPINILRTKMPIHWRISPRWKTLVMALMKDSHVGMSLGWLCFSWGSKEWPQLSKMITISLGGKDWLRMLLTGCSGMKIRHLMGKVNGTTLLTRSWSKRTNEKANEKT